MTSVSVAVEETLYIGGGWRPGAGDPVDVIDPATEQVLGTVASASAEQAHEALEAARRAQPAWSRLPSVTRGAHLRAMADVLRANRQHLADLIVSEVGKPTKQALDEMDFAIGFLSYSAEWDRRLEGETLPGDVSGEVIT